MSAINRKNVKIAIVTAATNPSDVAETDYIAGEIKSYDKTGGEKPFETDAHFGGDVSVDKPRDLFELGFEVTPESGDADRWESLAYGTVNVAGEVIYITSTDPEDKAVFIQTVNDDGTTSPMSFGFDNCRVTVLDMSHNADENMKKKLTIKFSSEDEDGRSNFMAAKVLVSALPAWTLI